MTTKHQDNRYWDEVWDKSNMGGSYSYLESRMERTLDKVGFFIQNNIQFNKGDKVLEAGCGDGLILLALKRFVDIEGYGIDFSEVAKKQAEKLMKIEKNYFDYKIGNVNELPYNDNAFDKIISLGVIEHFQDPTQSIKEMYRVLKPGGNLILMTPNKKSVGVSDRIIKESIGKWAFGYQTEYTPKQLAVKLECEGFKVTSSMGVLRRKMENDNKTFKMISILDQSMNLFVKDWGFYSYVFAIKE